MVNCCSLVYFIIMYFIIVYFHVNREHPLFMHTVKHVLKNTCIKQSPLLRGHIFGSFKCQISENLPVLSKHLS